jgi:hypothetical protein
MPQSSRGISVGDKAGCVELLSTLEVCSWVLADDDRLTSSRPMATCCVLRPFAMAADMLSLSEDRRRRLINQDGVECGDFQSYCSRVRVVESLLVCEKLWN